MILLVNWGNPRAPVNYLLAIRHTFLWTGWEKICLIQFLNELSALHLSNHCDMSIMCHAINESQSDFTENYLHVAIQGISTKFLGFSV